MLENSYVPWVGLFRYRRHHQLRRHSPDNLQDC